MFALGLHVSEVSEICDDTPALALAGDGSNLMGLQVATIEMANI